jgi:hypothetical protein
LLKLDKTPPEGDITHSPANPLVSDKVTFSATGKDLISGLSKIEIYVDDVPKKSCEYNGEKTEQTCTYLEEGQYTDGSTHNYYAIIHDVVGKTHTTMQKSFTVGVCVPGDKKEGRGPYVYCQLCEPPGLWVNKNEGSVCNGYSDISSTPAGDAHCYDATASFSKVCDLACTSGSCSNKINCNCEYGGDGNGITRCGAKCDLDATNDCPCPEDRCIDADGDGADDWADYPDYGSCTESCVCNVGTGEGEPCKPNIDKDSSLCARGSLKILTKIEGLKFNNLQLTGRLLDEFNQPINGKINIEYQSYDNVWHPTNPEITESSSDGSWSYNVNVNEIKRRFRVSYTPENDNYNPTSNTLIVGDFNNDKECNILDIFSIANQFACISTKNTIDNFEDGDYTNNPPWGIDCSGNAVADIVAGYSSDHALKITSTGGDGLACAGSPPYDAITGKKITYACNGSRCQMCVFDGTHCINDPVSCGSNLAGWTICQTNVTESNTNTNIYIYNDNMVNHWSVYDLIEDEVWTRSAGGCDFVRCPKVDINDDKVINILDLFIVAKNFGLKD